jgi:hypothetical protein
VEKIRRPGRAESVALRPIPQTHWDNGAFWTMMSGKGVRPRQEVPVPANSPEPVQTDLPPGPVYPGGENAPGYRLAFQAWMILFLLTLCVGLLNFLGAKFKGIW